MWYVYTMKFYSTINSKDIMNFAGRRIELEIIILNEVCSKAMWITAMTTSSMLPVMT